MSEVIAALAVLIWVALGASIGVVATVALVVDWDDGTLVCPYGKLLGMPCWLNVNGDYVKHRVVAVSHKGAVAVRKWEDRSGKHARWITKGQVKQGCVRFGEDPSDTGEVVSWRSS